MTEGMPQPRGADWADHLPPVGPVDVGRVAAAVRDAPKLVVLDDDPTGTQTVRDVPVLTRWTLDDLGWALRQGGPGFFVLTNTRSLPPEGAAARNREVAEAALAAAAAEGVGIAFASRGDSTLRGHYPLETDVLAEVLAEHGIEVDGTVLAPAYLDAGRVTLDGIHWLRTADGLLPVAESEYARDATFGYRSSRLADWVEERSAGRILRDRVGTVTLAELRDPDRSGVDGRLTALADRAVLVADAVSDDDLLALALAAVRAERIGRHLLYRVGPSFVRARLGQGSSDPIPDERLAGLVGRSSTGLVVVGSHVGLTGRQLGRLLAARDCLALELDVESVLRPDAVGPHLDELVAAAVAGLGARLVVLSTSRALRRGADEGDSLRIAARVAGALTEVVGRVVAARRPSFVLAKGGITSSDVATKALHIDRAWVRGSLLPGIVSLWEAASGPAAGLPYIVFAGNVGDDSSLVDVVARLDPV